LKDTSDDELVISPVKRTDVFNVMAIPFYQSRKQVAGQVVISL